MTFSDISEMGGAKEALESMSGVRRVRDGSTGSVQAIDFEAFELERPTNTSNFVFRRMGTQFQGGLIRLPRVSKSAFTEAEVRNELTGLIPAALRPHVDIRLEPEVELDDGYYYLHLYLNGTVQDALHITERVSSTYTPLGER